MKKLLALILAAAMLTGCGSTSTGEGTAAPAELPAESAVTPDAQYDSRFGSETKIVLSDSGILVNGGEETETVYTSRDIIYYEDRDAYESGNPYGEGEVWERHSTEEAAAHTVVNITAPGAYRVSGKLAAGQIRVDLGEDAYEDPNAVVELILQDADITCTVAPVILFLNTYECDGDWSAETASPNVDTAAAGANLILEGENILNGSHVARIFKDKDGEKKLWKQDGAIYSYMSMNVSGSGSLNLTADNEGLGTELHLTINGGNIRIDSGNDGINTNEDGVSVTTIHDGKIQINAGLGAEGDGIDSNGFLVINGGTVISAAKPVSDAGLDSDLGSFINGGTVIALGSVMDWAESEYEQVTMNLQFAELQEAGTPIEVRDLQDHVVFSWNPEYVEGLTRGFQGVILSTPDLKHGEAYHIYVGGAQLQYTGSDVGFGSPGMGGRPGGEPGEIPEGMPFPKGDRPEGMPFPGGEKPEDFDPSEMGPPPGYFPGSEFGGRVPEPQEAPTAGNPRTEFYMADMVNCFSGLSPAETR